MATGETMRTRLITIGIGGASCSGKTTLAKHLAGILAAAAAAAGAGAGTPVPVAHASSVPNGPNGTPSCAPAPLLIHQDDFAPPEALIPVHPQHGVQDWDDPETAIEWPRLRATLRTLRGPGGPAAVRGAYASNDHLNAQADVPLSAQVAERWAAAVGACLRDLAATGERVVFVLVDGFVLFYDAEVARALDVQVLLRVPRSTLESRRASRVYVLQNDADAGAVWADPPGYFSNIVYPAYVKAHAALFAGGDVEAGAPVADSGVVVLEVAAESEAGGPSTADNAAKERESQAEAARGVSALVDEVCALVLAAITSGAGVYTDSE